MEPAGFFRREPLGFSFSARRKYVPATCVNVDDMLFAPVLGGYWRQHETYDGTYNLDDLLDIIEVMQVQAENEERARQVAEREAKVKHG